MSSLLYKYSLRESSLPIQAICLDKSSGNIVTHDNYATRLWSYKKQIKSVRIDNIQDLNLVTMICSNKIERILLFFTLKKASNEKGGIIQILGLNLTPIQQVKLDLFPIIKFSISPSETEILFIDKFCMITSIHIEYIEVTTSTNIQLIEEMNNKLHDTYHPKKTKPSECLKLHPTQEIPIQNINICDILLINDHTFGLLNEQSIHIYTRPKLLYEPIKALNKKELKIKSKWMSKKEKALLAEKNNITNNNKIDFNDESSPSKTLPTKVYSDFEYNGIIILQPELKSYDKLPNILRIGSKDKIIVGYDNGSIQIVCCPFLSYPRLNDSTITNTTTAAVPAIADPISGTSGETLSGVPTIQTLAAIICEYQAHFVLNQMKQNTTNNNIEDEELSNKGDENIITTNKIPSKSRLNIPSQGVLALTLCPWDPSSGTTRGVGLGYQLELFSIGTDRRIAHWGIRYKEGQNQINLISHKVYPPFIIAKKLDDGDINGNNSLEGGSLESSLPSIETIPFPFDMGPIPMEADLLGEYQLPIEAPSHLNPKTSAISSNSILSPFALAFELLSIERPICKKLVCVSGGLLTFFDTLQPHRLVTGHIVVPQDHNDIATLGLGADIGTITTKVRAKKNDVSPVELSNSAIIGSSKGPELSQMNNISNITFLQPDGKDIDEFQNQSTIVLLKANSIDIVLVESGKILLSFPTSNLQEFVHLDSSPLPVLKASDGDIAVGMGRIGHKTLSSTSAIIKKSSVYYKEAAILEGKPSVIYYCSITHMILVGFTSGGVGIIGIATGLIHSKLSNVPFPHLKSVTKHDEISMIITFKHRLQRSAKKTFPPPAEDIVIALIGDVNGSISLWQISPSIKNGTTSALLSSAQKHVGKVIYAHSCLLEENNPHRIIVTACTQGIVKAWKLETDGSLIIMAYFQAKHNTAKVTATLAIPIITHEYEDEELLNGDEDNDLVFNKSSQITTEKKLIGVYHEIYCIVGYSNGIIECWCLSSNKKYAISEAITMNQDIISPIQKFIHQPALFSLQVTMKNSSESLFTAFENDFTFLSIHENGFCSLTKFILEEQELMRVRYFMLPNSLNNVMFIFKIPKLSSTIKVDSNDYNKQSINNDEIVTKLSNDVLTCENLECLIISDLAVYHILPLCLIHIPKIWHRSSNSSKLIQWQEKRGEFGSSKYYNLTLSLTTSPLKRNLPDKSMDVASVSTPLSYPNLQYKDRANTAIPYELNNQNNYDDVMNFNEDIEKEFYSGDINTFETLGLENISVKSQNLIRNNHNLPLSTSLNDQMQSEMLLFDGSSSISSIQSESYADEKNLISNNYMGSIKSMDRIISADLYFAKKDRKLLDLFTKFNISSDNAVSLSSAAEIVYTWLNTDQINQEHIWELFQLLEIDGNDRLQFIEVAKIAAVVTAAMEWNQQNKKSTSTNSIGKIPSYSKLKSYTNKVTYNSMGEKSIVKVYLSKGSQEGIWNGVASKIRRLWGKQTCRVLTQKDIIKTPSSNIILHALPSKYKRFISSNIPLPSTWTPENIHWFHPLRVIRIARTLLDIRSAKQHEVHQNLTRNIFQSTCSMIESMPEILVKFFERNYGDVGKLIDISRHKIVHFLEACCQYKIHPIVNILYKLLDLNDSNNDLTTATDSAAWLCVEARSVLCSRGCVIQGDLIQPFSMTQQPSFIQNGAALQVRWQYITKADAHWCTDEMLRARGNYGPSVYEHIQNMIDTIPIINSFASTDSLVHPANNSTPMIDLEKYLELLYFEFLNNANHIKETELSAFGPQSMIAGLNTAAREISQKVRSNIVMDDQLMQFGPYHEINLRKIKDWLIDFLRYDPLRTGTVSQSIFKSCVKVRADTIEFLGGNHSEEDILQFINFCLDRFVQSDPDAEISYIDMCSLLLAWENQVQGDRSFLLKYLIKTLPTIKRTIEQSYAQLLIEYFECISCFPYAEPIWTMGNKIIDSTTENNSTKESFLTSLQGNWNLNTAIPNDEPGLLKIQQEPIYSNSSVHVHSNEVIMKRQKTKLSTDIIPMQPMLWLSKRAKTNLFGETLQPLRNAKPKAILSIQTLTPGSYDLIPPDEINYQRNNNLSQNSYSRAMSEIEPESIIEFMSSKSSKKDPEVDKLFSNEKLYPQAPYPKTPEEINQGLQNTHMFISADNDFSSFTAPYFDMHKQFQSMIYKESSILSDNESGFIDINDSIDSNPTFQYNQYIKLQKQLASEEVARMRYEYELKTKDFEDEFNEENEIFKQRKLDKDKLRRQIRIEMKEKERISMQYYYKAIEEKFKHNLDTKTKMNEINKLMEADKNQKDIELQKLRDLNNMKSKEKQKEKLLKEFLEKEKIQSDKELKLMKNEEEYMIKLNIKLASEQKKAFELQKKADEEAFRKQTEELLAAHAAANSMNEIKEEIEVKDENEDSIDDDNIDKDDDNDDDDNEEGEDDDEDEDEDDIIESIPVIEDSIVESISSHTIATTTVVIEELTPAQKRMNYFLSKVHESTQNHHTHPRQDPNNTLFFMPMVFSEDIYFNPFAVTINNNYNDNNDDVINDNNNSINKTNKLNHEYNIYDEIEQDNKVIELLHSFEDVKKKVNEFQNLKEKQKTLLFSTSVHDIPANEWMKVFRKYNVNWNAFFSSDVTNKSISNLLNETTLEYETQFKEKDPLLAKTFKEVIPFKSTKYIEENNIDRLDTNCNNNELNDDNDDNEFAVESVYSNTTCTPKKITNLLIDNMESVLDNQVVMKGKYTYYKIDHIKPDDNNKYPYQQHRIVTIEVQCLKGLVEMYLSFRKIPCVSDHDRYITCTKDTDGLGNLSFHPNPWKSGSYFIAIYSLETNASFKIHAYTDYYQPINPIIARVDKILRKLQILASKDSIEMQENFTKLEAEAMKLCEEEEEEMLDITTNSMKQVTNHIIDKTNTSIDSITSAEVSIYSTIESSFVDNINEDESIGKFMMKIARYVLPPATIATVKTNSENIENIDFERRIKERIDDSNIRETHFIEQKQQLNTTKSSNKLKNSLLTQVIKPIKYSLTAETSKGKHF